MTASAQQSFRLDFCRASILPEAQGWDSQAKPCMPVQDTGRVVKHLEEWDVEPGRVLKRLLRPASRMPTNRWEQLMLSVHEGDAKGVWLGLSWPMLLTSAPVVGISLVCKLLTGEGLPVSPAADVHCMRFSLRASDKCHTILAQVHSTARCKTALHTMPAGHLSWRCGGAGISWPGRCQHHRDHKIDKAVLSLCGRRYISAALFTAKNTLYWTH